MKIRSREVVQRGGAPDRRNADVTGDVASEGGSPGDVEIAPTSDVGEGSEAGETWRPTRQGEETIRRDDTGEGRRSP
jgi:hypothetical protein